jgi:glutathione S-transferase
VEEGMYLCGNDISYADAAIFPSLVFAKYMFPKFEGSVQGLDTALPAKLDQYMEQVQSRDPAFRKVYDEVSYGLDNCKSDMSVIRRVTLMWQLPFIL